METGQWAWLPGLKGERYRTSQNKKVLLGLGVTEVVLGAIAIVVSTIVLIYVYGIETYEYEHCCNEKNSACCDSYYCDTWNMGEGIWCGVWILIGGALGISSSQENSSLCMIKSHLGFSIVGAIFSAVMASLALISIALFVNTLTLAMEILLAAEGFVTLILCITSAAYCCKTMGPQCCNGDCSSDKIRCGNYTVFPENNHIVMAQKKVSFNQPSVKSTGAHGKGADNPILTL